ncbi:MAG: AzlD domain-containing protein [Clostridiales bacterium]|nr:AzlD domain-containing protein [Clostridiales bacterium]
MDNSIFFPLLLVSALTTYLVRVIPFTVFRKKITNRRVSAFFYYIPYTVLSAMTFPAMLYSTDSVASAAAGAAAAIFLAYKGKNLLIVAIGTCAAAFAVSLIRMLVL